MQWCGGKLNEGNYYTKRIIINNFRYDLNLKEKKNKEKLLIYSITSCLFRTTYLVND